MTMLPKVFLPLLAVVALLFHSACNRRNEGEVSPGGRICEERIRAFEKNVQRNKRSLCRNSFELCRQITDDSKPSERLRLFRMLARTMMDVSLEKCTIEEKESLQLDFYRIHEYLAFCLIKNDATEEEAWELVRDGVQKYNKMCFSFGDENDCSDGVGHDARMRRRLAKGMRLAWENMASYFERRGIDNVFGGRSPAVVQRFLMRWHKEFGIHDEEFVKRWRQRKENEQ